MRKNLFMIAAVAIAAVACNKELPQEQLPAGETVTFEASVDGAETKTVLKGTTSEWVENDAITVHDGVKGWTFTTDNAGPRAVFSNSEGFGSYRPVMAAYPAGEWTANVTEKSLNAYIPTWQQAQIGTYDKNAALAVAYSEGDSFAFKNAVALLKFTVNADNVTHLVFHGNGSEALTGNVKVLLGEEGVQVTCLETEFDAKDENGNDIKEPKYGTWVECYAYHSDEDKYFLKGETYYIAVAPQVFEGGVTVKIRVNEGEEVVVKTTENKVETKASTILDLGEIRYDAPAVHDWAVAGTFNDWSKTATPMVLEGDVYVAKDITGLHFTAQEDAADKSSATGFQFVQKGAWKGGYGDTDTPGKLSVNSWSWYWEDGGKNIYVDGATAQTAYDIYLNPVTKKFVIVTSGAEMPEDKPAEVTVGYWAVVSSMSGWGDYAKMTLEDDWYVAKDVKLLVDDQFKFRADGNWDVNRGASGEEDGVLIANDVETDVFAGGKNFTVAEGAFYNVYLNKTATKAKIVKTADLPVEDTPGEATPGEATEWALVGAFSDWKDKTLLTTVTPDLLVLENVEMKAAQGFLVRKPTTEWNDKYGAGNVNYLKANHYIVASKDGADMCLEADGTYDIYFNTQSKTVYVMTAGVDYNTAVLQKENGKEPEVEEPEVTEKVVYLKPNSNWTQSNARFAAYFWGGTVGEKWVSMTAVGDGTYSVNLPEGYDYGCNVIFCRMNPSTTGNNWNNKWNQTSDLKTPTDGKNLYTVKAGTWDKGGGTWSVK